MKLKITKCSNDGWYSKFIGSDFFPDLPIENPGRIITGYFKIIVKYKNTTTLVNSVMCGVLTEDTNYLSVLRKEKLEKLSK